MKYCPHDKLITIQKNKMFFQKYDIYENKLSEQLPSSSPFKSKLEAMETPKDSAPVYSFLVKGLLAYAWIFFIFLLFNSDTDQPWTKIRLIISALNITFVTFCIRLCYKKDYLIGCVPSYRRNSYIMAFLVLVLSAVVAAADKGKANWLEILNAFNPLQLSGKSYIALAALLYVALGIAISYYSCPYYIYRAQFSIMKTHKLEDKHFGSGIRYVLASIIYPLILLMLIFELFNTPDITEEPSRLKPISLLGIYIFIPSYASLHTGEKYYRYFKKAQKQVKKSSLPK